MDTAGPAEAQKEKTEMRSCIPLLNGTIVLAAAFICCSAELHPFLSAEYNEIRGIFRIRIDGGGSKRAD